MLFLKNDVKNIGVFVVMPGKFIFFKKNSDDALTPENGVSASFEKILNLVQ